MLSTNMAPSASQHTSITVNGRTYSTTFGGAPVSVPETDAEEMEANGWLRLAGYYSKAGTTAQRPHTAAIGETYTDSTLLQADGTTHGVIISYAGNGIWLHGTLGTIV